MIFDSWPPIIVGLLFGLALLVWGWWPERKRKSNKPVTADASPITVEVSLSAADGRVGPRKRRWWRRPIPW